MRLNEISSQIAKTVHAIDDRSQGSFMGLEIHRTVDAKPTFRGVEKVTCPTSITPKARNPTFGLNRFTLTDLNHVKTQWVASGNHSTNERWRRILGVHVVTV